MIPNPAAARYRMTRGRFATAATAFATVGLVRAPARAAQFEFKCATNTAPDFAATTRLREMFEAIEQESGGRIHTQFFPNSQLGGDTAMLQQLRVGAITFNLLTSGTLASVVPAAEISFMGFAFKDAEEGLRAMDGPLGGYIRGEIEAKNIHALRAFWNSGVAQVGSNTHPIRVPDDMRNFKIRVINSKIQVDLFKALGATPTPLDFGAVYTALQTKLIDGEGMGLLNLEAAKFYEVNKYISLTNHSWGGYWLIVNGDAWKSLPPDLQEIVERNNAKYAMLERNDTKIEEASVTAKLKSQGMIFNEVDQAPFRARLRGYYTDWASTFGPTEWGLLETAIRHKLI